MKTHRIIVTRDKADDGNSLSVTVWPPKADPTLDSSGMYRDGFETGTNFWPEHFRRVFHFLPRKGSKAEYELRPMRKAVKG